MSEERIVVALDASPHSLAALRAAAQFAASMQTELHGLFVEDSDLLRLCALPFCQEIGSFSATVRTMDNQSVERQLRALAGTIERTLAQVAGQLNVRWSFQVKRGGVTTELLAAAENSALLSMGRASRRSSPHSLGSTTAYIVKQSAHPVLILGEKGQVKHPLTLLYTGTESATRALQLAMRLAKRDHNELHLLLWMNEAAASKVKPDLVQRLTEQQIQPRFSTLGDFPNPQIAVRSFKSDTLVLPVEQVELLAEVSGPVILVP